MLKTNGDKMTMPGKPYFDLNLAINLLLFENTRSPVIDLRHRTSFRYSNRTDAGMYLRRKVLTW